MKLFCIMFGICAAAVPAAAAGGGLWAPGFSKETPVYNYGS